MAHLTLGQRYEIAALRKEGFTITKIAKGIGKDKSVVCRELKRNSDGRNGAYKAELAQKKTEKRHLAKPKKISFTQGVKEFVLSYLLAEDLSPEQIVGKAKILGAKCVSAERIYQFVWSDKKAGGACYKHLRAHGKQYRKRGAGKDKRGRIVDRVCIEQRPPEVALKKRVGDLEMDLVIGKDHKGALLTINDRATGMLKMARIGSKEAIEVEQKAIELLRDWKPYLHTITTDNGKEFANHKQIAGELMVDYYFAHPYHSWERGANENLNGLVRQYFPKKTSFENIDDDHVVFIQNKLNNRPRKRFGFQTPNEVFENAIKNNGIVAFMT